MSELVILADLFNEVWKNKRVSIKLLKEVMENPIFVPYMSRIGSLDDLLFRLEKQGIINYKIDQDHLIIENINEDSNIFRKTKLLADIFMNSPTPEKFKENIHTIIELNPYFIDDEEINIVYHFLKERNIITNNAIS
ncbi:MAG: hypothetical protein ACTSVI_08045 [Promethearchaeota archaeon]